MNPQERATLAASRAFLARMSRLDALMGGLPRNAVPAPRARSADAER